MKIENHSKKYNQNLFAIEGQNRSVKSSFNREAAEPIFWVLSLILNGSLFGTMTEGSLAGKSENFRHSSLLETLLWEIPKLENWRTIAELEKARFRKVLDLSGYFAPITNLRITDSPGVEDKLVGGLALQLSFGEINIVKDIWTVN